MTSYGKQFSAQMPNDIEVTATSVFVATNIQPYQQTNDEHEEVGYTYDLIGYTKDEYIRMMAKTNEELQSELLNTQMALCEIYELLEGGE